MGLSSLAGVKSLIFLSQIFENSPVELYILKSQFSSLLDKCIKWLKVYTHPLTPRVNPEEQSTRTFNLTLNSIQLSSFRPFTEIVFKMYRTLDSNFFFWFRQSLSMNIWPNLFLIFQHFFVDLTHPSVFSVLNKSASDMT